MLSLLALLSELGCVQTAQDHLESQVQRHVETLSSDDAKAREEATLALKRLGVPALKHLENRLKQMPAGDARLRVQGITRDLWIAKADAFFAEGKLQESLLAQATAEDPGDPSGFLRRRIQEARKDLQRELPQLGEPKTIREWPKIADTLRKKHGRWCLPAIMDCLNPSGIDDPISALELLKH